MSATSLSQRRGRLLIALAAVLWSLSGAFVKLLTRPTGFGLDEPPVPGLVIAFYRVFFAGLVLLPTLRRADLSFRPLMAVMVIVFAAMNALFISALDMGSAANAIVLQYTAPMWMYLASVLWLKEPADRRSGLALLLAMAGVAVIVVDAFRRPSRETLDAVLVALGSGITYAGVLLCLRVLRAASARWLTVLNQAFAALVLLPVLWREPSPTGGQTAFLAVFGAVQLGLPYLLVAQGLKVVSPQEAGMITLIEPLLNPVWAFVLAGDVPDVATALGGTLILGALVWRYAVPGLQRGQL